MSMCSFLAPHWPYTLSLQALECFTVLRYTEKEVLQKFFLCVPAHNPPDLCFSFCIGLKMFWFIGSVYFEDFSFFFLV